MEFMICLGYSYFWKRSWHTFTGVYGPLRSIGVAQGCKRPHDSLVVGIGMVWELFDLVVRSSRTTTHLISLLNPAIVR